MDVEKEIAAATRRIQAQIDANVRAALVRLGFDVEAEAAADAERRRQVALAQFEALGAGWRELVHNLAAIGQAFSRGFNR